MKIQLDTVKKTISLEENVKLGDLTDLLEDLLPNGRWAEFTLIPQNIVNWNLNPIVIERQVQQTSPYWQPWVTTNHFNTPIGTDIPQSSNYELNSGVYNLEVKQ